MQDLGCHFAILVVSVCHFATDLRGSFTSHLQHWGAALCCVNVGVQLCLVNTTLKTNFAGYGISGSNLTRLGRSCEFYHLRVPPPKIWGAVCIICGIGVHCAVVGGCSVVFGEQLCIRFMISGEKLDSIGVQLARFVILGCNLVVVGAQFCSIFE